MENIPTETQIKKVRAMKLKMADVINLSNEDFNTWAYLKNLNSGYSDVIATVGAKRLLKNIYK